MFAGIERQKGLSADDYYGPPRPGQSFVQYESFMKLPIIGGAVIVGTLIAGPVGAIVGGIGGWLFSEGNHNNKPKTQGG